MSDSSTGSITQAFEQFRAGDARAAADLWQRFLPRLTALARKTLAGRPQRAADADDAVQSAFASFCQRAGQGEFGELLRRDDLWSLLGVMTVRKSLKQIRHETAAKRGGGAVLDETQLVSPHGGPTQLAELAAAMPAQEFDLRCEELLAMLDDELRRIAMLRLLGYPNREIAGQLNCTERRIERKLQIIRLRWEEHVG